MNKGIKIVVYGALYIGLACVCNYANTIFPILQMPNGGSIELGEVVIIVASFHFGVKQGVLVSLLTWVVSMMFGMNSYMVSIGQVSFDYILPAIALGLAAGFPNISFKKWGISKIYVGIVGCMVLKYAFQVVAGAVFWPSNGAAGSGVAWLFSLTYNFGYNFIILIIVCLIAPRIVKIIQKNGGVQTENIKYF